MANNYVIYSDETFRNIVVPDWVAELHGWPLLGTEDDGDGNLSVTPKQWTLYEGFKTHGTRAGKPFSVKCNSMNNLERCNEDQATDWAVPYNSMGGDFHLWIKALADDKPISYEDCMLSIKQIASVLAATSE